MAVFVVTFLCAHATALLILRWISSTSDRFRRTADERAVQRSHVRSAPRMGGIPLMTAGIVCLLSAWAIAGASQALSLKHGAMLLLASAPVFVTGLLEDMGRGVSPGKRLVAAAASGLLAVGLFGVWIDRLDLPGLDVAMGLPFIAIPFTAFAIAGVSHAFNLIDGLNGLAGLTGLVTSLGLVVLAQSGNAPTVAAMAGALAAAIAGFLTVNYPSGRLFLGDAGAYAMGFALAWLGVLVVVYAPEITPWAVLLVFFWPVADTGLAIWRRWRAGRPAGLPDRLHVHQLVMRAIEINWLGRGGRRIANPLATAILLPMISAPILAGVALRESATLSAAAFVTFSVLFVAFYTAGMARARRTRRRLALRLQARRPGPAEGPQAT
jgi:UDP-GlcNAc:undecaprenyl-phosphate/decaprenyl-phosphate GlcNAc-1-phosphate transferase